MAIIEDKSLVAGQILEQTYSETDSLLNEINANKTGYLTISRLFDQIRKDIQDALQRARTGTIRLGVLGGRGSGKSTLANALMGNDLLPESAIIFCTIIPTTIQYSTHFFLSIESELNQYNYNNSNSISSDEIKEKLLLVCKESENPQNSKKISKITLGVHEGILDGKEIVDVPGFTKGNPLHQAFAERYARYYCDVCLVLINNFESVEIDSHEGLDAFAYVFKDRLDSTIFIINKCDESSKVDIDYLVKK